MPEWTEGPCRYYETLPCGLILSIAEMPASAAGPYFFTVATHHRTVASGYSPSLRSALVCLRWALQSVLDRSREHAGKSIERALGNATH